MIFHQNTFAMNSVSARISEPENQSIYILCDFYVLCKSHP